MIPDHVITTLLARPCREPEQVPANSCDLTEPGQPLRVRLAFHTGDP